VGPSARPGYLTTPRRTVKVVGMVQFSDLLLLT
jgi:hypothetical protein